MARDRRQAWDPEPAKARRASGPTWHRVGWGQREFHTTEARIQKEQQYHLEGQQQNQRLLQEQHDRLCAFGQQQQTQQQSIAQQQWQAAVAPVVCHTHSCTYMYSFKQAHIHKTTLLKQWVPGENGAPAATLNVTGICDELNSRLLNIDDTLVAMLSGSRPAGQQKVEERLAEGDTEVARQKLAQSLEKQIAFSTALLLEWCGATPLGSGEQVLKKLLAA